ERRQPKGGFAAAAQCFQGDLHDGTVTWDDAGVHSEASPAAQTPRLMRWNVPPRPALAGLLAECGEAARGNGVAHPGHQLLVVGEIDGREQHPGERLIGLDEMMQVRARICACRRMRALGVERPRVRSM